MSLLIKYNFIKNTFARLFMLANEKKLIKNIFMYILC